MQHGAPVVGEQERPECLVNVRTRDNVVHGMQRVTSSPQKKVLILSSSHSDSTDLVVLLKEERASRSLVSLLTEQQHGELRSLLVIRDPSS